MATLAYKSSYPATLGLGSNQLPSSGQHTVTIASHRTPPVTSNYGDYGSPTESEFSDGSDDQDTAVRDWDEKRVGEWLRSIKCGQYEQLFKANNFNGANLLECDQAVLKDMGIKKIGDRVRIASGLRTLRRSSYIRSRRRNRDSFITIDDLPAGSSNASPRGQLQTGDSQAGTPSSRVHPRHDLLLSSRSASNTRNGRNSSGPASPMAEGEGRILRAQRYNGAVTVENARARVPQTYGNHVTPTSAGYSDGQEDIPQTARLVNHIRQSPSGDGSVMGSLPPGVRAVRIIHSDGETRVVRVANCKSSEDIMRTVLKKFTLPEAHVKNYCFYVLDGTDPDPNKCRRLSDSELMRICNDPTRAERNRFILRKIHAGEPTELDLQRAADIAREEFNQTHQSALANNSTRSQMKLQKLTGEQWDTVKNPMSANSFSSERERNINATAQSLERSQQHKSPVRKMKRFFGQRPPSELISADMSTYFPDHPKEEIEKTVRLSMRRSARLSRATSRLSTASSLSFASSLKDAPPIPAIADSWFTGGAQRPAARQSTIIPFNASYRESVASSMLQPLQEESPIEPNRKSYVSFDSGSESNVAITEPDGPTMLQSYLEDPNSSGSIPSVDGNGSIKDHLNQVLAEDGEEADEELTRFLAEDSWENVKWMKGAYIGQGSFGSVFIALHSITGALMAVKQVEMPGNTGTPLDAKKKTMVEALKHEISLLRDLKHENIVQYLGSSSDESHLNIFLEYVPGGSVHSMLQQYGPLEEPLVRSFVRQILKGLAYLHGRDIVHRDIKGANVLVDNKGGIKISDFGISKKVEASNLLNSSKNHAARPSLQGSVFWMAPEVVRQTSYTRKADIWSLGCLIVEMITGDHPYPSCTQMQAIFKIGNSKAAPDMPERLSEDGKDFLRRTFEVDHNKRPTAEELLVSPFFNLMA